MKKITGKSVDEGIEEMPSGGVCMTGDGIEFYRLLTLRQALKVHPLKLTRGPAATTLARRMLGIKGNRDSLLHQVENLIAQIQAERTLSHWHTNEPA